MANLSILFSKANKHAAAKEPACLIPPPKTFLHLLAFLIKAADPTKTLPTGAPNPLLKQMEMESNTFP